MSSNAMDHDTDMDSDSASDSALTFQQGGDAAMHTDLDDLLSDESDNDDLIENEDELQELLARENITIEHTAFVPSRTSDATTTTPSATTTAATATVAASKHRDDPHEQVSTSTIQPTVATCPDHRPTDMHALAGMPGFTVSSWETAEWLSRMQAHAEQEKEQERGAGSSFSSTLSQFELQSDATNVILETRSGDATIHSIHRNSQNNATNDSIHDNDNPHIPIGEEKRQQAEADSSGVDAPGPGVPAKKRTRGPLKKIRRSRKPVYGQFPLPVMEDENRLLTAEIKAQTERALEVNRAYQELLKKHLKDIEEARERNHRQRAVIQNLVERQEQLRRAPVPLDTTDKRIGPPYFVDRSMKTPPDNEDTVKINERPLVSKGGVKSWNRTEKKNLLIGVVSENKRLLFEKYRAEGDIRAIEALSSAPDSEMTVNTVGLSWERISRQFVVTRTPAECLIQWTGRSHPGINKSVWESRELHQLERLVTKYNGRNWIQIALELDSNRTAAQCFRMYNSRLNKTFSTEVWTQEEDNILLEAVRLIGDRDWKKVSYCFENRSPAQCRVRWGKVVCPHNRRGKWLEDEDEALRAAMTLFGDKGWVRVQEHVPGRTEIQCRERYCDYLDPSLNHGPWSPEDIQKLRDLVQEHGTAKWSVIAAELVGRTDSLVSRRWRMLVREDEQAARQAAKQGDHSEEVKRPKRKYLSFSRRKGQTTSAAKPNLKEHREEIRRLARLIQSQDQRDREKKTVLEQYRRRLRGMQAQEIQRYYEDTTEKQRGVYEAWEEAWPDEMDPIEKVFNLGIPPVISKTGKRKRDGFEHDDELENEEDDGESGDEESKEETQEELQDKLQVQEAKEMKRLEQAYEDVQVVIKPVVPDAESVIAPGLVRPVPPCVATMEVFANILDQGEMLGGRFRVKKTVEKDEFRVRPLPCEILSAQEQMRPEYRELAERFEATFMWPMLMGMLDQETGHAEVSVRSAKKSLRPKEGG